MNDAFKHYFDTPNVNSYLVSATGFAEAVTYTTTTTTTTAVTINGVP
jgi:hypothetical protein